MSIGWISLNRKIQCHWLWVEKREFSKLEAWLDILLTVNHTEKKVMIKNTLFTVKRGESIKSLETWSKRWNWNKSKVRRFLELLKSDSMIVTKNEHKTTRIIVCNYDSYQNIGNADETKMKQERNADETQMTPNNNDNNYNNVNNENKLKSFDIWWDLYDNKKGLSKSKQKFLKLSDEEIEKIIKVTPDYVKSTPDVKYRKNPLTWLNGKHWEDNLTVKKSRYAGMETMDENGKPRLTF